MTDFPHPDSLCERCGYPLYGLDGEGDCPECGKPIDASHPRHRTGPPWQRGMTARSYLATWACVVAHPRRTFKAMTLGGSNWPARLFLLSVAALVWVAWILIEIAVNHRSILTAWVLAMFAFQGVVVMSYIEVLGVTWFSRRRSWRVPLWLAERVVGYAAVGWPAAAALLGGFEWLMSRGLAQGLARWLRAGGMGPWAGMLTPALWAGALMVALLGFETLVWRGVRQVKFANEAENGASHEGPPGRG